MNPYIFESTHQYPTNTGAYFPVHFVKLADLSPDKMITIFLN